MLPSGQKTQHARQPVHLSFFKIGLEERQLPVLFSNDVAGSGISGPGVISLLDFSFPIDMLLPTFEEPFIG